MVEFRPCTLDHIMLIRPQPGDLEGKMLFAYPQSAPLLDEFCLSAWAGNKCVAAAGIVEVCPNIGSAWSLLGADCGPYLAAITRKARQAIEWHPLRRIQMTVLCDFEEGHRWARMLGMTLEAPRMRCSSPFGKDESLYAKVKDVS